MFDLKQIRAIRDFSLIELAMFFQGPVKAH